MSMGDEADDENREIEIQKIDTLNKLLKTKLNHLGSEHIIKSMR